MKPEIKTWLYQIKEAIAEIRSFVPPGMTYAQFVGQKIVYRAVEMDISIIGEAMNRILREEPDIAIEHARRIVQTRNRIIHDYDKINLSVIWVIVDRDLEKLNKEVEVLLR